MEKTIASVIVPEVSDPRAQAAIAVLNGEYVADPAILSDVLQLATEQLNPLIERAEKALTGLRLNVAACVTLTYDTEENWGQYLGFRKDGREWGLFVDSGHDGQDPAEWDHIRLQTASRETRLVALSKLPELKNALVVEANRQCSNAMRVVLDTDTFLATLEARKP